VVLHSALQKIRQLFNACSALHTAQRDTTADSVCIGYTRQFLTVIRLQKVAGMPTGCRSAEARTAMICRSESPGNR